MTERRNIKIGLMMEDKEHAIALARGIARESRSIDIYLDTVVNMDMVLTDVHREELSGREVLLVKGDMGSSDMPWIDIFDDSRTMSNRLSGIYYDMTGQSTAYLGTRKFRIVSFCQIRGGSGVTSTAMASGRMMDLLYGARTLYMNLTSVDDSSVYFGGWEGKGPMPLMYRIRKDEPFPLRSHITSKGGVDKLWCGMDNRCIEDLDPSMMGKLLDMVEEMGIYDYVFMDVGNQLVRSNMEVLDNSDCVILVESGNREGAGEEGLKSMLLGRGASSIVVKNRINTWELDSHYSEEGTENGSLIVIPKDISAFQGSGGEVDIDLKGRYGIEISRLAREIVRSCGGEHKERNFGFVYRNGERSKS